MHETIAAAKNRQKKLPAMWIAIGTVVAFFLLFLYQLIGPDPPIVVSKETTFITEPLREDGLPDYRAYLLGQSSEGVTHENNAAVLLWQAMWPGDLAQEHWLPMSRALGLSGIPTNGMVEPSDDEATLAALKADLHTLGMLKLTEAQENEKLSGYGGIPPSEMYVAETIDLAMDRPWNSEQLPALAKWITRNEPHLELLIEASQRPRYYSVPPNEFDNNDDELIATLLPDVQLMRGALRCLLTRAMWHLGENRAEAAWRDLLACHRLARLVGECPFLVGQLVAIAIDGVSCQQTQVFLDKAQLTPEQARAILRSLQQLKPASDCATAMNEGERYAFLDMALALARGRAVLGDLSIYADSEMLRSLEYARIDWNASLRMGNKHYDALVLAAERPTRSERLAAVAAIEVQLEQSASEGQEASALLGSVFSGSSRSRNAGNILIGLMLPSLSGTISAEDRGATQLELTRLAAALAVYRAEQGEYPQQLADLVPEVIPELPVDLYSEKSFLYQKKDDGGYLLYSVYENEVDDGGTNIDKSILNGEWMDVDPEYGIAEIDTADLVIRMPVPKFEYPEPPTDDEDR